MSVKKVISKTKVPIKIWCEDIENEALEQAIVIADHFPIHSHLALMPDVHCGAGIPIGSVLPLINGISPYAVGSDIGCGMLAVKLNIHSIAIEDQKKIFRKIREEIPVGFNHRKSKIDWSGFKNAPIASKVVKSELEAAQYQLGTLGGGNHFIEFQIGSDHHIWFMIHSGSRNLGKRYGDYYNALALEKGISTVKALPFFLFDSSEGQEYCDAMNFALDFAQQNREVMSNVIMQCINEVLPVEEVERINKHHNYASEEVFDGVKVVLHRKGATYAGKGSIGIIPGSQGSASYIVRGVGNKESFESCSHGAGRVMSRSKAKKLLDPEVCTKRMMDKGILVDFTRGNLDEAEEAYKDIAVVMDNQSDLVDIVVELKPYQIAAIKG